MTSQYELFYLPMRGRAEVIRIALAAAGRELAEAGVTPGVWAGLLALPLRGRFERAGLPVQTGGAFYFWAMRSGALFGGVSAVGIAVLQRLRGANDVVNPTIVGGSVGVLWRLWPRSLPGSPGRDPLKTIWSF